MQLATLYNNNNLSHRAYKVCKENNLKFVMDLRNHYLRDKTFLNLEQSDENINRELIEVCIRYVIPEFIRHTSAQKNENLLFSEMTGLSEIQEKIINTYIIVNIQKLTQRSKNALTKHLADNLSIQSFIDNIFHSSDFKTSKIRHVGLKSVPEIEQFLLDLQNFVSNLNKEESLPELEKIRKNIDLKKYFAKKNLPDEIFNKNSVFYKIQLLILENILFKKNKTHALTKSLHIFNDNKHENFKEITNEVDLSLERVRQVVHDFTENIIDYLSFAPYMDDDFEQNYGLDLNQDLILIDLETANRINEISQTKFSNNFIAIIIYLYLQEKYELVGEVLFVLFINKRNARTRYSWNNLYLLKKDLASQIDFNTMFNDIEKRVNKRIPKTYGIPLYEYLDQFSKTTIDTNDYRFIEAVKKMVKIEFGTKVAIDTEMNFIRNTFRQIFEYAYEALDVLGKPSKLRVIQQKILELHPEKNFEMNSVRASMKRKHGFVPIGRKSTFGLKKWEKTLPNFKGGTIRDIAIEFLSKKNTPQKFSDVAKYVLKYRPKSNPGSIASNLKLDETGRFVLYELQRVGLSSKEYPSKFKVQTSESPSISSSWDESLQSLLDFIQKYNRLPKSSVKNENEIKFYRWLNVQKLKYQRNELHPARHILIGEIVDRFPELITKRKTQEVE